MPRNLQRSEPPRRSPGAADLSPALPAREHWFELYPPVQALLELLGVGVAELDERGVVGFANPVFSALAGGGRGAEADRLRERLATEGMKVASGQGIVEWVDEATGLAVRLSPGGRGEDGAPLVLGLLCREAMDPEALEKCRAGLRDRAGLITPQLAGAAAAGQMPPEVARAVMVEHEIRGLEHILDGLVPVSGGEPEGGLRLLRAVESMVWLLRTERDRAGGSTAGGIEAVELLRELSETWAPLAKRKGLRWSCQCRLPKTERIPGEPAVLRMVLGNLIDNAIRSTPSGDVQVMVRVTGSGVLLQVADTGPGFPSRDRELLFEWFERGAAGRGEAGWGVGLSLCRELVGGLGGAIRLSARPGGGSRVRVFLPDPERTGAGPRLTVLVIDDDPLARAATAARVRGFGLTVVEAETWDRAAKLLRRGRIRLVLTDLCHEARPVAGGPPWVAVTGRMEAGLEHRLLAAGFAGVLLKPLKAGDLEPILRRHGIGITDTVCGAAGAEAPREKIWRQFLDLVAEAPEKYQSLGELVQGPRPRWLGTLESKLAAGSLAECRALVHRWKGVFDVMGEDAIAAILGRAERAAAEESLADLRAEVEALGAGLKAFRKRRGGELAAVLGEV